MAALADHSGVEFFINSDEEIGSTESRELIEQAALRCGAVLVFEASADGGALKIGRKGVGTFRVDIQGRASHAGLEPEKGINSLIELAAQVQAIAQRAGRGRRSRNNTTEPSSTRKQDMTNSSRRCFRRCAWTESLAGSVFIGRV
mgnify:CR=1 FL=1